MTDCESFHTAQAVAIQHNKAIDSWELYVSWFPHPSETASLETIVAKHGLEMVTSNGRTVFRLQQKLVHSSP